jgi:hypothetical protein
MKIKEEMKLQQFLMGKTISLELKDDTDFIQKLVEEINEGHENEEKENSPSFTFSGEISKDHDSKVGDYLLLTGDIKCSYFDTCVKTGDQLLETLKLSVHAAIVDDEESKKYNFDEVDTIYLENAEYDLFLTEGHSFNLKNILSEYVYLNRDPYPEAGGGKLEAGDREPEAGN